MSFQDFFEATFPKGEGLGGCIVWGGFAGDGVRDGKPVPYRCGEGFGGPPLEVGYLQKRGGAGWPLLG